MKRRICFGLVFALVATLATATPLLAPCAAWAQSSSGNISRKGGGDLKLDISGPVAVSLKGAQTAQLTLTAVVTNTSSSRVTCNSLQVAVIDPWTGTRILGPTAINGSSFPFTLLGQTFDEFGNPVRNSKTVTFSVSIPKTVPGTFTSTVNKTLAVLIYALDNANPSTVQGVAGWGFVTNMQ